MSEPIRSFVQMDECQKRAMIASLNSMAIIGPGLLDDSIHKALLKQETGEPLDSIDTATIMWCLTASQCCHIEAFKNQKSIVEAFITPKDLRERMLALLDGSQLYHHALSEQFKGAREAIEEAFR